MRMSRAGSSSAAVVVQPISLAGALAATLLVCSSSYAASFGHSRLASAPGQPLRINVPVSQLSADDLRSFAASPAPAAAWQQAGLTPPVDLSTMQVKLIDGYRPGSKLMQVSSSQPFNSPVADILLDVSTATGQQRFQVSLLTNAGLDVVGPAATASTAATQPVVIKVRRGDTMFAIAQRHAVPGVTVYQMMIALQRANPQAFIHNNLNLVRAGASLTMPDRQALTAISDREARRLFMEQAWAFAQYRQRAAGQTGSVVAGNASSGLVSASTAADTAPLPGAGDQLRLSGGQEAGAAGAVGGASNADSADDAVATGKGIEDSQQRVTQLEDNVRTLNEALRSQGAAASDLVISGAKGISDTLAQVAETNGDTASGTNGSPAPGGNAATSGASAGMQTAGGQSDGGTAQGRSAAGADGNDVASASSFAGGSAAAVESGMNGASDAAATAQNGSAGSASTNTGSSGQSSSNSAAAINGSSTRASSSEGSSANGSSANGASANGSSAHRSSVDGSSSSGSAANESSANGSTTNGSTTNGSAPAESHAAGAGTANGTSGDGAAAGSAAADGASDTASLTAGDDRNANANANANAGQPGTASGAGAAAGASAASGAGTASAADAAAQTAESISSKAEQSVSWFQEHMLAVITGLLAFMVLVIAWLLRRANAARGAGRDSTSGPITEAMVKEKLDQINLDLEQDEPPRSRPDTR